MNIPAPFLPVRVTSEALTHTVSLLERTYTFGADGLLSSVRSQGVELLHAPVRIVAEEDGEASVFDDNYAQNESESFIQSRDDGQAVICGTMQSDRFIVNICNTVGYDGCIDINFSVMLRGKTVAQVFGISGNKQQKYELDKLWLEIPLKKEAVELLHMFPNSDLQLEDGRVKAQDSLSMSGRIPAESCGMPHKAMLWLGNEERGFGFYSESDENWQPENPKRAIELVHEGDSIILRIRLLDSQPSSWLGDTENAVYRFLPVNYRFGFCATPTKKFPKNPYIHNALHLDCGKKIEGNYMDFLAEDNRFDRLAQKGVTTLILHEKWNKSQNCFELSEYTEKQIRYICDECHRRGIKVLTYFGYEISTIAPVWQELHKKVTVRTNSEMIGGWWRVPFQRNYIVCYNSEYSNIFVEGVARIMDTCHTDGIYLDGTALPQFCKNTEHGCGYYDKDGHLHGTYPILAIREHFRRLYEIVESRGGEINLHCSSCLNFTAVPYVHGLWLGENLQFTLMHGNSEDVNLDYFRTEYIGRNMGVPAEFIAYENRPIWRFETATACAILHGILPRPNDIDFPLEYMSKIWRAFDSFPIEQSEFMPYWKNKADTAHPKVKVSYYRYRALDGKESLLAAVVNISPAEVKGVQVTFEENVTESLDMLDGTKAKLTFDIEPYGYKLLYIQ